MATVFRSSNGSQFNIALLDGFIVEIQATFMDPNAAFKDLYTLFTLSHGLSVAASGFEGCRVSTIIYTLDRTRILTLLNLPPTS